jgi:hypothetical protein
MDVLKCDSDFVDGRVTHPKFALGVLSGEMAVLIAIALVGWIGSVMAYRNSWSTLINRRLRQSTHRPFSISINNPSLIYLTRRRI